MRRARIAAALTGLALTGIAAPAAMADEKPQASPLARLIAEQQVLRSLASPFIGPGTGMSLQEIRDGLGQDRLNTLADQRLEEMRQPTADSKFEAWRKDRDAKQREAFLGRTDSQLLGLNPFLKP